jgi:hypothetical protein
MGSYMYKVTSKTVDLDNGEKANVAVFAYKPTWAWDGESRNKRWHFLTGAATCDRHADSRTGWVVGGYVEDDGTISVDNAAWSIPGRKYGSYVDDAIDHILHGSDGRAIWARVTGIPKGMVYSALPRPMHPSIGMLQKADGGVSWYAHLGANREYFESRDLNKVERRVLDCEESVV